MSQEANDVSSLEAADKGESSAGAKVGKERDGSRFNAAFPAWLALLGVVVAAVIGSGSSLIVTSLTIKAGRRNETTQRYEQLKDAQRAERRVAYQNFLIAAEKAVEFERAFWCDTGGQVPLMSGGTSPDYHACSNAPNGRAILAAMTKTVPLVALYAGDDTRKTAYEMVTNLSYLLEQWTKLSTKLKASNFSDDPTIVRWQFQADFFRLVSFMCREQSVLPNKCQTPSLK